MKTPAFPALFGGALASAFLAIGLVTLAQRFDPVTQRARQAPALILAWEMPPAPPPTPGGSILDAVAERELVLV